jgi:Soluble lytic murein transglycosylase and related regulatory proteins (some contain LysM/invasin domains)
MRAVVRSVVLGVCLLSAAAAQAQVKLTIRGDGTKVIYNLPTRGRGASAGNLEWLAKQRNRSSAYDPIIDRYAKQWRVDPILVKAVIQVESDFDPRCVSRKGARGLMQLMPDTARRFNVARIHDPDENIRGGIQYLAFLLKQFRNDFSRALAAYNAGENAVSRYGGIPPYEETQIYVRRAMTVYHGRPYGGGMITFAGGKKGQLGGGFKAQTAPRAFLSASTKLLSTHYLNVR